MITKTPLLCLRELRLFKIRPKHIIKHLKFNTFICLDLSNYIYGLISKEQFVD